MSTLQTQEKLLYTLDKSHSTVEFVVRHLMISKVRGRFASFDGQIDLAPGSDLPEAISANIDVASIDTREEQRDAHLKSADFFEVEKYPALTFASTRVEGTPDDFKVYGNLTIHGVTKEVVLAGSFEGRGADPWGGERVGYSAHTTINRKDFGLTWNAALETGGVVVSDEVKIELNVQAVLQK
ncbi:MAG TPA: YceI family protein [Candidatus Baltobacteraceae bacterium]|nr:YceI family protein [Candidatus Baltobacteraceae bacterium]